MSWLRAAILPLLLGVAACGFQPLYGRPGGDGQAVSAELASIEILPIADRPGQLLYNRLLDGLSPYGRPGDPQYVLRVTMSSRTEELVFREDETATRANLILLARYQLRRASDGEVVFSGDSRSTSSYDILENPFATLVSEDDAVDRATRELGTEIRRRLAVFLSSAEASAP